ncbi:MAG: hypothetical protein IH849_15280 [Acidobacteria bacterium]|nr:hypothetical protein [Acidobacteriota bacterium]
MKMFANHYSDTPHGESHPTISVSVLLTLLFVGAQWVIFVLAITTSVGEPTIYSGSNPFATVSMVVAMLLLVFLAVDLRRNRLEAHGGQRFQYIVFGLALTLLGAFMFFLVGAIQQGSLG